MFALPGRARLLSGELVEQPSGLVTMPVATGSDPVIGWTTRAA
ncbi:MAG: hypothetical protein U0166_02610 [Acidobacteriota bacterium]